MGKERMRNVFPVLRLPSAWKYEFDWNDLRAVAMVVNVVCVLSFGATMSWVGIAVSVMGIIRDFVAEKRVSGVLIHISSLLMNVYFLSA